jgi:hypothetical protein
MNDISEAFLPQEFADTKEDDEQTKESDALSEDVLDRHATAFTGKKLVNRALYAFAMLRSVDL